MKRQRIFLGALMVALFCLLVPLAPASSAAVLHGAWTALLQRYVSDGLVDYQGFKQSETELDRYLDFLSRTQPSGLERDDRLAFYINAYNAYTVKLILKHFEDGTPPGSIRDIGTLFTSPWEIAFATLGGTTYTLDDIEHDIIRKTFAEPRIHFAVNCASKSCPPLIAEAYEGDTLDKQLERSTRNFLSNPHHNRLEGRTLMVSSIFKWYGEDFDDDPVSFFLEHADESLRRRLAELGGEVRVKYLDYDWSLNALAAAR